MKDFHSIILSLHLQSEAAFGKKKKKKEPAAAYASPSVNAREWASRISSLRCPSSVLAKKQMWLSVLMTDALGYKP